MKGGLKLATKIIAVECVTLPDGTKKYIENLTKKELKRLKVRAVMEFLNIVYLKEDIKKEELFKLGRENSSTKNKQINNTTIRSGK